MSYFSINGVDYSMYVNSLKIHTSATYTSQTNAAGNTVVDYINTKRQISVGIIPLDDEAAASLLTAVDGFNVSISFLNPKTKEIETNVNCIIPKNDVDYFTIRADKTMGNGFNLKFTEV